MMAQLWGYFRSSCSWRVRIVLALKNIEYETIPVHLIHQGGQQHASQYLEVNQMAQVPTWCEDRFVLSQSLAIIEYLEEKYPEPAVLPNDLNNRALVRQMAEIINSGVQPLQNLALMQALEKDFGLNMAEIKPWCGRWIEKGLLALEGLVDDRQGYYCLGDSITLADVCLVPQIYNARRFSVDLSSFTRLLEIEKRLSSQPAFHVAHPDTQPDKP